MLMKNDTLIDRLLFRITLGILLFLLLVVRVYYQTDAFVLLNHYHSPGSDIFFAYFTYLGDGLFCCAIIVALWLCGKKPLSYKLVTGFLLSGLFVQVLKNVIRAPRPKEILSEHVYSHFINGVTHVGHSSFPSGHTATAIMLANIVAFNSSNTFLKILLYALALAVGYSRIYLGQHFAEDVLGAIIVGLLTAKLVEYIFKFQLPKWTNYNQKNFTIGSNRAGTQL